MKKANGFKAMVKALELARIPFYTLENVYRESDDEVLGKCLMHEIYLHHYSFKYNKKGDAERIATTLCMRFRDEDEDGNTWLETVYDTGISWHHIIPEIQQYCQGNGTIMSYHYGFKH